MRPGDIGVHAMLHRPTIQEFGFSGFVWRGCRICWRSIVGTLEEDVVNQCCF